MQFVFIKNTGETQFVRDDAITAQWTQEEMSLDANFPYDPEKTIEHGMWIAFQWNGEWQVFEIRNARDTEPDHMQQITAESLVISELTDEHMDECELDMSAEAALRRVLTGTLWSVGEVSSNPVSSADIARGTVWQAVNTIKENWNVYIEPHYTLDGSGNIGRTLNIIPTGGTYNGIRLSVDKNLDDPTVTWDESNLITAIKGYGATIHEDGEEEGHVLTFADAVWSQTASHPAKPLGDVWLIDPEANALYSRNGRPRRGYYQNTDIEDPNILLQKSWEELRKNTFPDIQIEGTVTDLYRLGYADEPILLHDLAIVEIKPTGLLMEKEIIRLTVDLLNPANTVPTIGNYIPNIIYINRKTNEAATGSKGGGGGRGKGQTDNENDYYTNINANKYFIQLEAGYREEGDDKLHSEIVVTASEIRLEVKNVDSQLRSTISQTASQIRAEVANTSSGLYSTITQTASQIRSEVSASNSTIYTTITQTASQIRSEVANTSSGIYSSITQTASQIRSEVSESNSTIYTTITQTASQIRSEVANTSSGIYSSITQTASQIRSEVAESDSTIYSSIEQTSSQIRSEVANTSSSLSSSIQQNADKIGLVVTQRDGQNVVDAASIVLGINSQTGSYVQIQAAKINLDAYVTASQLRATQADIDNLKSGTATATWLKTGALSCTGNFYLGNSYIQSGSTTVVTGVDFTNKTVSTTDISYLHK